MTKKVLLAISLLCLCSCQGKESEWKTDAESIEVRYQSGVSDTYTWWQYSYLAYKEESEAFWVKCVSLSEDVETTRKYVGCIYKVERR